MNRYETDDGRWDANAPSKETVDVLRAISHMPERGSPSPALPVKGREQERKKGKAFA